jgi:hypothetical protein
MAVQKVTNIQYVVILNVVKNLILRDLQNANAMTSMTFWTALFQNNEL